MHSPAFASVPAHVDALVRVAVGSILAIITKEAREAVALVSLKVPLRQAVPKKGTLEHRASVRSYGALVVDNLISYIKAVNVEQKVKDPEVNVTDLVHLELEH